MSGSPSVPTGEGPPRPPRGALVGAGALLLLGALALGRLAADGPVGPGARDGLPPMLGVLAGMTAPYLVACWLALRRPERFDRAALGVVLGVAAAGRLLLVPTPPLLETDPYRYVWDGAVLSAGVSPYRYAPLELLELPKGRTLHLYTRGELGELRRMSELLREPRLTRALTRINHPGVPTVYPPAAQGLFLASHLLAPGSVVVLKLLLVGVDLLVLLALGALLGALGRPRAWLVLYAWCPLVWKEVAASAHYDTLAALAVLLTLLALVRGRRVLAGVALGVGALVKVYPLLLLFPLARGLRGRGAATALAVVALGATPFLVKGPRALEGTLVFGTRWVKNASVFEVARAPFRHLDATPAVLDLPRFGRWQPAPLPVDSLLAAKLVLLPLGLGWLAWLALRTRPTPEAMVRGAMLAVLGFLALCPVVQPWYGVWILPLAALEGSVGGVALACALPGAYAWHLREGYALALPAGLGRVDLRLLEYAPVALALVGDPALRAGRDRG